MKKTVIIGLAACISLFSLSLDDLRHTPEGQIIRQAIRGIPDEAHQAALLAASASKYAWSHDALELSIKSAGPAVSSQPDRGLYYLLTGTLMYYVSVENCRYYTPLLARFAKEVPELAFGVTKLLGRANTPESAAALGVLVDDDSITEPVSVSNMAISALVDDVSEPVAQPVVQRLITHGHSSAARQMVANVWANRVATHKMIADARSRPLPPEIANHIHLGDETMNVMKRKSAAELASFVTGQDRHEAETAVKILADQAEQHPLEVRTAVEKGLESPMPTIRVRSAAVLLDIDSQ